MFLFGLVVGVAGLFVLHYGKFVTLPQYKKPEVGPAE